MTIAQWSTGHLTEDTAKVTDAWIRAGIETATEKGSHMEQLKVTIHVTSPQICTTIDAAVKGNANGMNRTGKKAAGVSTNEGGVEPGPIAHPPRWVQQDLKLCFYSSLPLSFSLSLSLRSFCLCLSLTIYSSQPLELVSSTIFMIYFLFFFFCINGVYLNWHFFFGRAFSFLCKRFSRGLLIISHQFLLLFRYTLTTTFLSSLFESLVAPGHFDSVPLAFPFINIYLIDLIACSSSWLATCDFSTD